MRICAGLVLVALLGPAALAGEAGFSTKPSALRDGEKVRISFTVSAPTDVEVAVLDSAGGVVRHLAAGALGTQTPPPEPLNAGLAQTLEWNLRDDLGRPAAGGPFQVRVRLGLQVKLDGFLTEQKEWIGDLRGLATDDNGRLYVYSSLVQVHRGMSRCVQVFGRDGKYLRTIMPMPADLSREKLLPFNKTVRYRNTLTLDPPGEQYRPRNYSGTWPDFYPWGMGYLLPRVSNDGVLTFRSDWYLSIASITSDGGCAGDSFARNGFNQRLWGNKYETRGARCVVPSPDGRHVYLSGFGRSLGQKSDKLDPAWPLGRIYRMNSAPGGFFQKWMDLPDGAAPAEAGAAAFDPDGHLLVWNGGTGKVAVLGEAGKMVGQFAALATLSGKPTAPKRLFCHRKTGEIYADYLCARDPKNRIFQRKLVKYAPWGKGADKIAEIDLPDCHRYYAQAGDNHAMALDDSAEPAVVWAGTAGRSYGTGQAIRAKSYLLRLEDRGKGFTRTEDLIDRCRDELVCKTRMAVHPETDLVVYNDGYVGLEGVNGLTGEQVKLPIEVGQDMAVGLNGNWYFQVGPSCYTGPICRYDKDLKPIPVPGKKATGPTAANALGIVYSRIGAGYCTVGLATDARGRVYSMQMWTWARYGVAVYGPDGVPEDPGRLREHPKMRENPRYKSVLIGPLGGEVGGIQLDRQGNVYVGKKVLPPGHRPPAGYEHNYSGYLQGSGTIIKFALSGGAIVGVEEAAGKKGLPVEQRLAWGSVLRTPKKLFAEGALKLYPGLGCMGGRFGDGCMCRQPMFQVDAWGRLFMPNAILNHVRVVDNAGNEILEFGHYGNIDSRGDRPGSLIKTPDIPLGWPQAVGVSRNHVYVADVLNRRIVRLKKHYSAEESCRVK